MVVAVLQISQLQASASHETSMAETLRAALAAAENEQVALQRRLEALNEARDSAVASCTVLIDEQTVEKTRQGATQQEANDMRSILQEKDHEAEAIRARLKAENARLSERVGLLVAENTQLREALNMQALPEI